MIQANYNDYPKLTAGVCGRFEHLEKLIGKTPLLAITYRDRRQMGRIFVKCEHYSLTGSVKDRMALHILKRAYQRGEINPGDTIVEATSGNSGIAFAALGRVLGHPVHIIMPDWLSAERYAIIRSLRASITTVSREEGGFLGSIRICEEMAARGTVFLPRQFENPFNAEAHEQTTMQEISSQLENEGLSTEAFIAGVGTGGTVMGAANYFKKRDAKISVHPLEPAESPTLSTGYKVGSHRIQGISDEFIPALVNFSKLDKTVQIHDGDAILTAQKLAAELGLAVGISSGANVAGAIKLQRELGRDTVVVTLLCDSNKKYLTTDLIREEPVKDHYIAKDLEFISFNAIDR